MNLKEDSSVLVVAAHPDDEVLGVGGTLSRLVDLGNTVSVIILTNYESYRKDLVNHDSFKENSIQNALKCLGVTNYIRGNFPALYMDTIPLKDIVEFLENNINKIKPSIVFTHSVTDLNKDHQLAFEATMVACRPMPYTSIKEVYSYEIPSSTEYTFSSLNGFFKPDTFIELNDKYWFNKIKALDFYKSEMREYPHPRSTRAIEALAQLRGSMVGVLKAESFQTIRSLL